MREFCVGDPTPPIFHLLAMGVGIGGNANFSIHVGGYTNCSVSRYQHVGIPKRKIVVLGVYANTRTQREWFCVEVE